MKRERPGTAIMIAVTLLLVLGMMTPLAVSPPGAKAEPETPEWVWSPQVSGTTLDLFGVSALDERNVWAAGQYAVLPGMTAADVEPPGAVFKFNGASWSQVFTENTNNVFDVEGLAPDQVWTTGGMGIYYWDGTSWENQLPSSPEPPLVMSVSAVDANNVWAVEQHRGPGDSQIYYFNGTDWSAHPTGSEKLRGVFALDANNVWAVGEDGTILYWADGTDLLSFITQASGTTEYLYDVFALAADNAWAVGSGGTILHWDGVNWSPQDSGTTLNLRGVTALAADNAWAVGENGAFLHWDGAAWSDEGVGGSTDWGGIAAIAGDHVWAVGSGGAILMGTWAQPSAFYFAEGYTGRGFQEYLALGNPNSVEATATVTYMLPDGAKDPVEYTIPANSRNTIDVNSDLLTRWGYAGDVSLLVESGMEIIAERPMYFDYMDKWKGGHDAVGATAPATEWYFAEGYTGPGFEMWICVLNPGDAAANLTFRFQTQEEDEEIVVDGGTVPPRSRRTFLANDLLGGTFYQTSLKLESSAPVVAERPMYFSYQGMNSWNWQGGHCVMGATSLAKEYFFAEGTTRTNFEEWITLQNPNDFEITVNAVYQLGPGQGEPVDATYNVPPRSRNTVFVPGEVGLVKDVSAYLTCAHDFLAERPMYFTYSYGDLNARGGHCVIGSPAAGSDWFLAEGYTGPGFNQWVCIQNPGDIDGTVEIAYYTQEAGPLEIKTVPVPANTRNTILVNDHAGPNYQLSTRITVVAGPDIVVERPMYFLYNGVWDGGHDVVGYAP